MQRERDGPQGLLGLPPEIRERIYELVVVRPQNTITMLSNYACHQSEVSARQPAISMVNHQLRDETLPIFYSMNVFLAEVSDKTDLATAKRWLGAIGDENVQRLRQLALCGWRRVPFGHMISKRWLKVVLDLKWSRMDVEDATNQSSSQAGATNALDELRASFMGMVAVRKGRRFDGQSVGSLMDGFNNLCTIY